MEVAVLEARLWPLELPPPFSLLVVSRLPAIVSQIHANGFKIKGCRQSEEKEEERHREG